MKKRLLIISIILGILLVGLIVGVTIYAFYAPFEVTDWWQILIVVAVLALVVGAIWWLYRKGMLKRLISIRDNKKQLKLLFSVFFIIGFVWLVIDDCRAFVVNAIHGIEVTAESATPESVRGIIIYQDDGREETKRRIEREMGLVLEKRTIIGWRKVKEFTISKQTLSGSRYFTRMQEGDAKNYQLNLRKLEVDMSKGIYRVKQEITKDDTADKDSKEKKGTFYIVFRVEGDSFNPEYGPIKESEQSSAVSKVTRAIKKDENYQSYFGGIYLKKNNVVVHVTNKYRKASPEVKEFLRNEEGVIVRKVKYTELELEEAYEQYRQKRMELEKEGDEEAIALIKDCVTGGIYIESNRVLIRIVELNQKKARTFRRLFGNDKRIELEMGGVVADQ